ncbi:hypothetical protein TNCV_3923291 [Trichonephila clavipes]|nr:hypothetical protein TNCV_3923291 [Trichonephila clavipes]
MLNHFISHRLLPAFHPHSFVVPGWISNLDLYQNDNSSVTKYLKEKDKSTDYNLFNQTISHSTHVFLWRRTGEPTHDLHHQERQLWPSQNIQQKKDVKSIIFPPTLPHSTTFVCGAVPDIQLRTSIKKNDNSGRHKIFNRKKMLNRFYFPPTLPHSTHIRLWCRAGYPT